MSKQWTDEETIDAHGKVLRDLETIIGGNGYASQDGIIAAHMKNFRRLQCENTEAVGIIERYRACMGELRAPALTKTADAFLARNSTLPAAPDTKETK